MQIIKDDSVPWLIMHICSQCTCSSETRHVNGRVDLARKDVFAGFVWRHHNHFLTSWRYGVHFIHLLGNPLSRPLWSWLEGSSERKSMCRQCCWSSVTVQSLSQGGIKTIFCSSPSSSHGVMEVVFYKQKAIITSSPPLQILKKKIKSIPRGMIDNFHS